jgi:glycosyltransferase involved in cell wall biosynthesis
MTRLLTIDIFSPLPPCPTDIANHTAALLPALSRLARVRVWTAQNGPVELEVPGVELCRFNPETLPIQSLNVADATFFNLGNNAAFHRDIHAVARCIPGIVVLHDTSLQHFFASYGEKEGPERQYYLDLLERAHGSDARALAEDHIAGRGSFEDLVKQAPMTLAALDGTLGAILHNRTEYAALQSRTNIPLYYIPLSFRFGPAPERTRRRTPDEPSRLVMFGFIGANRRLTAILEALAGMPDRAQYRLDIYGLVEEEAQIDAMIASAGLAELVIRHGFVPEPVLDEALANADLALNLRWPSMGEASGSQLRIWSAKLPALVTRVGWYAQLPDETVFMIDPEQEREGIVHNLRALRRDPARYGRAGERGRMVLEAQHSPERYARELVAIAAECSSQHARRMGATLAETCAGTLLKLGPAELARPLGDEIARRIAELTGTEPSIRR